MSCIAYDFGKLERDLVAARAAAVNAARTIRDEPPDNHDCAVLHLPGADGRELHAVAARAGVRVFSIDAVRMWEECFQIIIEPIPYRGLARTELAEMMARTLKARGWGARVYYSEGHTI